MMIAFVSLPTMYGIKGLGFSRPIVNIDIFHSTLTDIRSEIGSLHDVVTSGKHKDLLAQAERAF